VQLFNNNAKTYHFQEIQFFQHHKYDTITINEIFGHNWGLMNWCGNDLNLIQPRSPRSLGSSLSGSELQHHTVSIDLYSLSRDANKFDRPITLRYFHFLFWEKRLIRIFN
jgi:hypothetical protein